LSADRAQRPEREEDRVARQSSENREDSRSGDEGIDESSLTREAAANSTREDSRNRDVREGSTVRESGRSETEFTGRGGQKEGESEEAEGTGYTNDRSEQLQEDDSLSGSQGKHGTTGNRQGQDRVGGQTAQNPRGSEVDRSVM
jgi:hypothetical protein